MSAITATKTALKIANVIGSKVVWGPMADGDTVALGQASLAPGFRGSFQVEGTFDAADTLSLQGSNDGVNWHTLIATDGSALAFTAADVRHVAACPLYVIPALTGGGTTSSLTITAILAK